MEGLIWASLLSLIVKRSIAFSVSLLEQIELPSFIVAKITQGWFYQLMEAIINEGFNSIKAIWAKAVEYLGKYTERANPKIDRKTGRAQYCVVPVTS